MTQTVKDTARNAVKHVKKLQVTTPSDREIAMTRVFDAPRSLVFDAWTKPELLKRWLGVFGGRSQSAKSISRWAASIVMCGAAKTERKWGWAAYIARS